MHSVQPRAPRRGQPGFTLVELLVVIGIIAVLISVLLPSLSKARAQGMRVTCMSNIRQIYLATQLYATDNKGFLPRYTEASPDAAQPNQWKWNWTGLIFKYVNNNSKVFACPARVWKSDSAKYFGTFQPEPNGPKYGPIRVAYAVNGNIPGGVTSAYGTSMNRPFGPCFEPDPANAGKYRENQATMRMSQVANDTIMVVESVRGFDEQSAAQFNNNGTGTTGAGYGGVRNLSISSHDYKSASLAFADGHVDTAYKTFVFKDPKYDITQIIDTSQPSWQNWGAPGDLQLPNNTNRPRGYWSAAKGD